MSEGNKLDYALQGSVDRCVGTEEHVGVAFSGGLDSSLIAHLALRSRSSPRVRGYVFAVGEKAPDLPAARRSAMTLGLDLVEILADENEVRNEATKLGDCIGSDDRFVQSFELPLWFVAREAEERVILLGQGADELFGGYARYQRMSEAGLAAALDQDAAALPLVKVRESAIAARWGKEFRYPYLDAEIVLIASGIPVDRKVTGQTRKIALRDAARRCGIPESVAGKEKKAAQYGSGSWRVLRPKGAGSTPAKR